MPKNRPFLRAEWRDLVMLNFRANVEQLMPFVPQGTEIDTHEGQAYVSLVGFRFLGTRVFGIRIPGHQRFEEVNLRLYVRRKIAGEVRRGVVFIQEIAPKRIVAYFANRWYHEHYTVYPMRHTIRRPSENQRLRPAHGHEKTVCENESVHELPRNRRLPALDPKQVTPPCATEQVEYAWLTNHQWNRVGGQRSGPFRTPDEGSLGQYIVEHYWGYGRNEKGQTLEYRVEHTPWQIAPIEKLVWDCDISATYGEAWAEVLRQPPISSFLADGSAVSVMRANRL